MNNETMNNKWATIAEWLRRNWAFILAETILLYALLYFTFVWKPGLWLWIYPDIRVRVVEVTGMPFLATIWPAGSLKWLSRMGCSILALIFVLAFVFVASIPRKTFISEEEYLSSVRLNGSIYHLVSVELSGQYYSIYRCDDLGIACEEVDYFAGFATNERVAFMAHSDTHSLVVLFLGKNGYEVLHGYHPQLELSP